MNIEEAKKSYEAGYTVLGLLKRMGTVYQVVGMVLGLGGPLSLALSVSMLLAVAGFMAGVIIYAAGLAMQAGAEAVMAALDTAAHTRVVADRHRI